MLFLLNDCRKLIAFLPLSSVMGVKNNVEVSLRRSLVGPVMALIS